MQVEKTLMNFHVPGYRNLEKIESGGQGTVWRTQKWVDRKRICVKTSNSINTDQSLRREYEIYLKILSRSPRVHEFIPEIFEYSEYQTRDLSWRPFISFELVQGIDLNEFLQREHEKSMRNLKVHGRCSTEFRPSSEYVLRITRAFYETSQALDWLHNDCQIAHRDLKPENLMILDGAFGVKIVDFGLSQDISQKRTEALDCVGTIEYLPPEFFLEFESVYKEVRKQSLRQSEIPQNLKEVLEKARKKPKDRKNARHLERSLTFPGYATQKETCHQPSREIPSGFPLKIRLTSVDVWSLGISFILLYHNVHICLDLFHGLDLKASTEDLLAYLEKLRVLQTPKYLRDFFSRSYLPSELTEILESLIVWNPNSRITASELSSRLQTFIEKEECSKRNLV